MDKYSINMYVSVDGSNKWSGCLKEPNNDCTDGPMATIEGVLNKLRFMKRRGEVTRPVNVWIRGGRYEITKPIVLKPEDSAPINFCAYPDEEPVIDGGRKLTGWKMEKVNEIEMWTLSIPEVAMGKWYFRQLFVNGERRSRTRLPKQGYYWMKDVPGIDINKSSWEQFILGSDRFVYDTGDMKKWDNFEDVEVVVHHFWVDARLTAKEIDEEKNLYISDVRSAFVLMDDVNRKFAKYYVENTFEALTEQGEWYLDRKKGKLFYIPMEGETFENTEIYAPYIQQFIRFEGEPEKNRYIDSIRFEGITFIHSDWYHTKSNSIKSPDYFNAPNFENVEQECGGSVQAAIDVPGSIYMKGARNCAIENCKICHIGLYGIELYKGCSGNRIAYNEIFDIGAGGVRVNGSSKPEEVNLHTCCNEIFSNHIYNCGNVFKAAIGVLMAHSYKNRVRHNLIHDLYYSGISSGWSWGYGNSISKENLIECNHIHHLGKKFMSDMGGIYVLGIQPGTVIRGNLIHDVESCNYGGWGVYLDEGSSFVLVEKNVVFNASSQAFHQHMGRENMVRNNIFALCGDGQIIVSKKYSNNGELDGNNPLEYSLDNSVTFQRNIVLSKNGGVYIFPDKLKPADRGYITDMNIYWDVDLKESAKPSFIKVNQGDGKFIDSSFDEWQAMGYDLFSLYQNPLVDISEKGICTIDSQSPAYKLGFRKIDIGKAGLV